MEAVHATTMTTTTTTTITTITPANGTASTIYAANATLSTSAPLSTHTTASDRPPLPPTAAATTASLATAVANVTSRLSTSTSTASSTTSAATAAATAAIETFTRASQQQQQPENASRYTVEDVKNITRASLCTTTMSPTSTEDPFDEFGPPEGVEYIFVPLGVMIFVIVLSAVVIIISRKRKLERLRHRLMPLYNFDPGEEGEDDWETELLDEGFSSRQRRKTLDNLIEIENK